MKYLRLQDGGRCFGWLCNWLNIHEVVSNSITLEVPHYFHSNLVYMKMFENFTFKLFSLSDSHPINLEKPENLDKT